MDNYVRGFAFGLFIGAVIAVFGCFLFVNRDKEDCEKDLPRTQECTLQWVKPEADK